MSEQQYQCPVCNQIYFSYTAHLHEHGNVISEQVNEVPIVADSRENICESVNVTNKDTNSLIEESIVIKEAAINEPKKRGPKPKVK